MVETPTSLPAHPAPRRPLAWDVWGDGTEERTLPPAARILVRTMLRGRTHPLPRVDPAHVALTPSQLTPDDLAELERVAGAVDTGTTARARHLGGKSTLDLIARRDPGPQRAPDAVVIPADHAAIALTLRTCAERGIAVVPFGGGTSVVGGLAPDAGGHRAVVALDLAATAALIDLDPVSQLATFGAGTTGPQAEELLAARGFTLGHFPQSFEFATIGGFAATRSSGQASRGYGRFDDLVHALRVATPRGDLQLGAAPASAAGPDLRQLFLGSEGALGVLTEVTVRVRPTPAVTGYGAWTFADFDAGAAALRDLAQRGIRPAVVRLSDAVETTVNAAMGGHVSRLAGCLAIATFKGADSAEVDAVAAATARVFAVHGGKDRGEAPAQSWERGRFRSPSLRDALLDAGVLAETLETATTWSRLVGLKTAVTAALNDALADTRPIVMCHISHVYPTGASLYFTVVASATPDPSTQWQLAKRAASDAIVAEGATITHHHAVGRDHRAHLAREIGPLGMELLRAAKRTLDPDGILNPGVLVTTGTD